MPAVSQKIRTGLVELRTKSGSVYISPTLWERVSLLWTFRNFHSLPKQVLNHREQHLIDKLGRTGIVQRAPVTKAWVIGAVENVELWPESNVEAPISAGKLVRMRVAVADVIAPRAVGSEGISIRSNRAVRDREAERGFRKRPSNVQSIAESLPYSGTERAPNQVVWMSWTANRLPAAWRWVLVGACALTLAGISLQYRKYRPAASAVVAQGAINVSQAFSAATSVSAASAESKVVPTPENIQHAIIADRTQPVSPIRAALRDREPGKSSPTKAVVPPQPSMDSDESVATKPLPERLRITEAPTSFNYPVVPDPTLTGRVNLKAVIGSDGTVTTVEVLSGKPALAKAAMRAVKHWRYRAHELDGHAVEAETNIEFNFHGDEVVSVSYPAAQ